MFNCLGDIFGGGIFGGGGELDGVGLHDLPLQQNINGVVGNRIQKYREQKTI